MDLGCMSEGEPVSEGEGSMNGDEGRDRVRVSKEKARPRTPQAPHCLILQRALPCPAFFHCMFD